MTTAHVSDYYRHEPTGIFCGDISQHLPGNLAQALQYVWRAGKKPGESQVSDYKKAAWFLRREADRMESTGYLPQYGDVLLLWDVAAGERAAPGPSSPLCQISHLILALYGYEAGADDLRDLSAELASKADHSDPVRDARDGVSP
jgi:hypothetical protein